MRQVPELEFRDDRSMEYAEQITRTLRDLQRSSRPTVSDPDGEGTA
jgi:ribosome-binding factor A